MSNARLRAVTVTAPDSLLTPSAALLMLRLVVGLTFVAHGVQKLGDLPGTADFFASLGIPAPQLMSPLVTVTETVGGLLLIAGLATPLVGAALAADMLVAFATAHVDHGFFASDGGGELVLLLGGACLALVLGGAGRYSADAALGLNERLSRALARAHRNADQHR